LAWRETILFFKDREENSKVLCGPEAGKVGNLADFTASSACGNSGKAEVFGVKGFFS